MGSAGTMWEITKVIRDIPKSDTANQINLLAMNCPRIFPQGVRKERVPLKGLRFEEHPATSAIGCDKDYTATTCKCTTYCIRAL